MLHDEEERAGDGEAPLRLYVDKSDNPHSLFEMK